MLPFTDLFMDATVSIRDEVFPPSARVPFQPVPQRPRTVVVAGGAAALRVPILETLAASLTDHAAGDDGAAVADMRAFGEPDAAASRFLEQVLWPALHGRYELVRFDRAGFESFLDYNRRVAERLAPGLSADDRVCLLGLDTMPLAAELRRHGVRSRIGFYYPAPLPSRDHLAALPGHQHLFGALMHCDFVGLGSRPDVRTLADYFGSELLAPVAGARHASARRLPRLAVVAAAIDSIDTAQAAMSPQAQSCSRQLRHSLAGCALLVGWDVIEPTGGLLERLNAFERLLEDRPDQRRSVSLLQLAEGTRRRTHASDAYKRQVERAVGGINGCYADADWTPVRFLSRPLPLAQRLAAYREARAGLMTASGLANGFCAQEFVASQNPRDPGVLLVAGLGDREPLAGALAVNPRDSEGYADAIAAALQMPLAERQRRWESAMNVLQRQSPAHWRKAFLSGLEATGDIRVERAPERGPLLGVAPDARVAPSLTTVTGHDEAPSDQATYFGDDLHAA